MSPSLEEVLKELEAIGDLKARDFLKDQRDTTKVDLLKAQDGELVFVVNGQSQDSRRNPRKDAENYLKALPEITDVVFLYGLGSPVLFKSLMERTKIIYALEASPELARAFFSQMDLLSEIRSSKFKLLCPSDISTFVNPFPRATLIQNHASVRRNPFLFDAFKDLIRPKKRLSKNNHEDISLLIVPPLSGGPLSIGPFLQRAALGLNLRTKLIEWPEKLISMEHSLKRGQIKQNLSKNEPLGLNNLFSLAYGLMESEIREFSPDLFLSIAQAPLDPMNLIKLRELFPDLPFAFWFVEDLKLFSYAENLVPLYDYFFHIQGKFIEKDLQRLGVRRSFYLPPGSDENFFKPANTPEKYRATLSFMGAGYQNRKNTFQNLIEEYTKKKQRGLQGFKIFGSGWDTNNPVLAPFLFEGGRRVSTKESALIYAGSMISLNIHSGLGLSYNPESYFVNPRTFEIASCGGFQIIDRRPLLNGLFDENELSISDNPETLLETIEYHLANPELIREKGKSARERVLTSHTFTHRLKTLLDVVFT